MCADWYFQIFVLKYSDYLNINDALSVVLMYNKIQFDNECSDDSTPSI